MAAPTPTDLEVLRRLAQTPEGRLLVKVFQDRLAATDKANRRLIGEQLVRGVGRALELEEILADVFGVGEQAPPPLQPKRTPTRTIEQFRVNHMAD